MILITFLTVLLPNLMTRTEIDESNKCSIDCVIKFDRYVSIKRFPTGWKTFAANRVARILTLLLHEAW